MIIFKIDLFSVFLINWWTNQKCSLECTVYRQIFVQLQKSIGLSLANNGFVCKELQMISSLAHGLVEKREKEQQKT